MHTGFYRRFIKDFLKIAHPSCKLLEKVCMFHYDESILKLFDEFKERLVSLPIIISPNWSKPFIVMCDASGVSLGEVLEQRRDRFLHPFTLLVKLLMKPKRTTP